MPLLLMSPPEWVVRIMPPASSQTQFPSALRLGATDSPQKGSLEPEPTFVKPKTVRVRTLPSIPSNNPRDPVEPAKFAQTREWRTVAGC